MTGLQLSNRLATFGFHVSELPDGRPAYVRSDGQISEVITNADDRGLLPAFRGNSDLYTIDDDAIAVGTDSDTEPVRVSMPNILAALSDPSDDYVLLSLRIHNGLGNAWAGHVYEYSQKG